MGKIPDFQEEEKEMNNEANPFYCIKHKRPFDYCSVCHKETNCLYPFKDGYSPFPDLRKGTIKPPQGGTGETQRSR